MNQSVKLVNMCIKVELMYISRLNRRLM